MSDKSCPFCGSKTIYIETPYIDRYTGDKQMKVCCLAQKKNVEYISHRRGSRSDELPEDISKL